MEYKEFSEEIKKQAKALKIELTAEDILTFYTYMQLLIEGNEKINLTAILEPKEMIKKHFVDSMTICSYIKEEDKIIDIGSGAGFPGVPIKIIKQNTKVILLDSLHKRINFLTEVINKLSLQKIEAICSRAEELAKRKEYREQYDVVTSRAVAKLNVLVEYMLPFVKVGGIAICMKGFEIQEELENSKKAIFTLGGEIEKIEEITLPNTDIKRKLIIIRKVENTKEMYPRCSAKIAKKQL